MAELAGEPVLGPADHARRATASRSAAQGDHRVRLVRGPAIGHRGRLQAVRGVVPWCRTSWPASRQEAQQILDWRARITGGDRQPEGWRWQNQRVLGIVLAGGAGKRLAPLTADRAKPAVPFGGLYRLVDFALSNLVNAGILRICVLTQYKSHSLDRHITTTWRMSDAARQLRDAGAGPAAARPALVHRLGRRHLPVAEPDLRRAAGPGHRVRRRPRVPDGPAADDRPARGARRRGHRGRDPGAARTRPPRSA